MGWSVPGAIEVKDGDLIYWSPFPPDGKSGRFIHSGPGLLDQFLKLADATPEKIRDYARRWGVLQICQHGLPASHNPQPVITPSMIHGSWCRPVGKSGTFSDPLESW